MSTGKPLGNIALKCGLHDQGHFRTLLPGTSRHDPQRASGEVEHIR